MSRMPSIEVRRQRWLEFADFMENLPELKFNHSNWCKPDHTCKTTACVAGWGAIRYSSLVKEWLDLTFQDQKNELKLRRARSSESISKLRAEGFLISEALDDLNSFDWEEEGRESLYLTFNTTNKLFYPSSYFWWDSKRIRITNATNKDIALIFRYLATLPVKNLRLPAHFNREILQKRVTEHFSKEQNNV